MRKYIISGLLTAVSVFLVLGGIVFAQETELPDPGLTPDSPLYFLETIAEEIVAFFTFGDLKKAEMYAALAVERLAEAKAVVEKGKPESAEKALERYEDYSDKSMARAEKAMNKGKDFETVMDFMAETGEAMPVHLEVLTEVYEQVPDQAKTAIENAMKASLKGHSKAVEALKASNRLGDVPGEMPLPANISQEARERIQMGMETDLMVEQALQVSESPRELCLKAGGPQEMCEKIPERGFRSFKGIEDFCRETGAPSEVCSSLESMCRELGVTKPDDCMRVLMISSTKAYQVEVHQPSVQVAPTLPEEE